MQPSDSSRIRLILLDFDGTLADTRRANTLAYVAALGEAGYTLTEEEYTRIDEAVQEAFGDVTGDSGMSEGEIYETDTQDAAAAEVM